MNASYTPSSADTRDRVIRLEAEVRALTRMVDEMSKQIDEMHDLLMRARGAKYLIVILAAVAGFFTTTVAHFIKWISNG